jgi:hypothetical protein
LFGHLFDFFAKVIKKLELTMFDFFRKFFTSPTQTPATGRTTPATCVHLHYFKIFCTYFCGGADNYDYWDKKAIVDIEKK